MKGELIENVGAEAHMTKRQVGAIVELRKGGRKR